VSRIPLTKVANQLAMVIDSDSFGDELALSAFARMEDRREAARAAGFQDHLVKPVKAQVLVAHVAALLRKGVDLCLLWRVVA
jgi:response regulator RpfG family c-di-GMP phosphodiesterase